MTDSNESELAGTKQPLIISPEEAKKRITGKGVRDGGSGGGHAISRKEAVSIAVQIGQEVYDQLRAEHALSMGELSDDLKRHFREIKTVTAANILDIQRRSFSYRIRRDFDVDLQRMAATISDWWDRNPGYWWYLFLAWLELHGLRTPAEIPEAIWSQEVEDDVRELLEADPENVGAPSELPEPPEVARAFTLSSHEDGPNSG